MPELLSATKKRAKAEKKPKILMIIAESEEADSDVPNGPENPVELDSSVME